MRTFWTILVIVVIIVAIVLINKQYKNGNLDLSGRNVNQTETGGITNNNTTNGTNSTTVPSQIAFTVNGGNFYFKPNTITVKQGDTVTITFINDEGTHDFKIDEFNVASSRIGSGAQEVVTFVADKKGSFEYYCSVGTHRQMGMWGTLVVQ